MIFYNFLFNINLVSFSDSLTENVVNSSDASIVKSELNKSCANSADLLAEISTENFFNQFNVYLKPIITYTPYILVGGFVICSLYYTYQYSSAINNFLKLFYPDYNVPSNDEFLSKVSDLFIYYNIHSEIKRSNFYCNISSNKEAPSTDLNSSSFEISNISSTPFLENTQVPISLTSVLDSNIELTPVVAALTTIVDKALT